jgi:hypothetical protein
LERWARRPTTAQALAQRTRVIFRCAAGQTNTRVARERRVTKQTVGKWRFLQRRVEGWLDERCVAVAPGSMLTNASPSICFRP